MASVTSAYRHKDSPQRGRESWNQSDGFTSSEYTRTYHAVTNTATTDESVILQSSYLPQMFDVDPSNYDARVISRDAYRTASPTVWTVEVTYSTHAPTAQNGDSNGTPLGAPVEWESSYEPIQVVMSEDINGDPIRLSNGLRPNPPLMVTRFLTVHRATLNVPSYPFSWANTKAGRVNSDNYLGCDSGTLMCRIPSVVQKYSLSFKYYNVKVEFVYDPRGWQPRLLNAGYLSFFFDEGVADGHVRPIPDTNGQDVTEPWPLDSDGFALSVDDVQAGNNYTFTDVLAYESAAFIPMGLGTP